MSKIKPVHYKKLVLFFEKNGFVYDRTEGDHMIFVKAGILRPIVIPMYSAVPVFIILNNLKSAQINQVNYRVFFKLK